MEKMKLDRDNKDPLHLQIKNILLDQITMQMWKPGDFIPSERELCEKYGVSRITIRKSLADLEREGLIKKIQGKGTFVTVEKFVQPLKKLRSFSEDMRERGYVPSSNILMFEIIPSNKFVSEKLEIPIASDVILLKRLRLADNEPMAIETAYLVSPLCNPLLDQLKGGDSLYKLLYENLGIELGSAQQSIEVGTVNGWEANLLNLVDKSLVLLTQRLTLTKDEKPIEFVTSKYRGDRYKFFINLEVVYEKGV